MLNRSFKRNVRYLISATRGGVTRSRIMELLFENPLNPNQVAEHLGIDYKTVTHHLNVLKKNNWVTSSSEKYNELFYPTFTEEERKIFEVIVNKNGNKF